MKLIQASINLCPSSDRWYHPATQTGDFIIPGRLTHHSASVWEHLLSSVWETESCGGYLESSWTRTAKPCISAGLQEKTTTCHFSSIKLQLTDLWPAHLLWGQCSLLSGHRGISLCLLQAETTSQIVSHPTQEKIGIMLHECLHLPCIT